MRPFIAFEVCTLALVLAAAPSLRAGPAMPVGFTRLANDADLVVVASVVGTLQQGWVSTVTLDIDRVLKGSAIPGSSVVVQRQVPTSIALNAINFPRVDDKWAKGLRGLWFLKKTEAGAWELLPTTAGPDVPFNHVFVPVPAGVLSSDFSYSPADAVIDKIARELGAALEKHAMPDPCFTVFEPLSKANTPGVIWLYDRLAKSPEAALRVMGWAGKLRLGDLSALPRIEQDLPTLSNPIDFEPASVAINSFGDGDPPTVQTLGRIATSAASSVSLRRAATYALFSIHTQETLPFLAALLSNADEWVRRFAMSGLAAFANSGHMPGEAALRIRGQPVPRAKSPYATEETLAHFPSGPAFEQNQSQYVDFWKAWWTRMQAQILGPAAGGPALATTRNRVPVDEAARQARKGVDRAKRAAENRLLSAPATEPFILPM